MDWKSLISDLKGAGVTQQEIGAAVGLSQPAVSDLARGRTHEVSWGVGQKLIALHEERYGGSSLVPRAMGEPTQPPSSPRPLRESGQGANSGCLIGGSGLIEGRAGSAGSRRGGARKTAGECQEVA